VIATPTTNETPISALVMANRQSRFRHRLARAASLSILSSYDFDP
jgi:hypothetical protein